MTGGALAAFSARGPRILIGALCAACLVLIGVQPTPQPSALAATAPPPVRSTLRVGVWTLWRDRELKLAPTGPDRKILLRTCAQCAPIPSAQPVYLRAAGNAVTIAGAGKTGPAELILLAGPVTLTAHGESLTLQNPVTVAAHAGVLAIVVTMPVESYVERVVASESGAADSAESLRALAVVVRTFALHQAHGHAGYDLCDSTHCQLLHWSENRARQPAAHAATLATAGETLWFHGERALAYFSKDCGGYSAAPTEVWPRAQAVPYLPSQPDRYCVTSGGGEWATEIARADLSAALAAHGLARPGWRHLTVARRSASGRAVTLRLDATEISAEDFRMAVGESLGWNKVPSTRFEVSEQDDRFLFHGRGWGHGVGLCQKGASMMAAEGRSAQDILAQYFPRAQALDERSGRAWQSFTAAGFKLESLDVRDAAFVPDLARARAEASQRSGLNASEPFTVRAFTSASAFRDATLAPGWVAAFTEGDWIGTQPLRTLTARHLLAATLRHEFLHALVEHEAGPATPLWLREGLVEAWSEDGDAARGAPGMKVENVEAGLKRAATEAESAAAHRAAGRYAQQLLARYGRARVLVWLRAGIPAGVAAGLGS